MSDTQASDPAPDFHEHRYRSHDGLSLYYRDYGAGDDVVVCLPGLTRNSKDFEDVARHLAARGRRVLTPDLRGRGQSDRDPKWKQYLPPTYVRDTWILLDGLGIDRVAIIGTSLGGLMAMIMADQQPQRLRGVVLNDIGPEITPHSLARLMSYVGLIPAQADWTAATTMVRESYAPAFPDEDDAFWDAQTRKAWRSLADGRVEPDYDPQIRNAAMRAVKAGKVLRLLQRLGLRRLRGINLDPWDNFRQLTMPTLLLRGAVSDVLSREIVERMRGVKPDLEVVEVPDRGHAPTLDEPVAREAVDAFLERLRG